MPAYLVSRLKLKDGGSQRSADGVPGSAVIETNILWRCIVHRRKGGLVPIRVRELTVELGGRDLWSARDLRH